MKKLLYLIPALLLASILFYTCQENINEPTQKSENMRLFALGDDPDVYPLYAGQSILVGEVQVYNDVDLENLFVKFVITDTDWCLEETHVAVAISEDGIPQKNGNPSPGQFPYKHEDLGCVTVDPYTIPLPAETDCGDLLVIATHAVVLKQNVECIDFESYTDEFTEISNQEAGINFFMADATPLENKFNASIPIFQLNIGDVISVDPTGDYPIIGIPQTYPPLANIAGFTGPGGLGGDDFVNPAYTAATGVGGNNLTDTQDRENYPNDPIEWHRHNQTKAITFEVENQATEVSLYMLDPDGLEVFVAVALNDNNEIVDFYSFTKDSEGITADGAAVLVELSADENLGLIKTVMAYAARKLIGQFDFVGYAIDNICITTVEEETAWGDGPGFPGSNWATYFTYTVTCPPPCNEWIVYGTSLGGSGVGDKIYKIDLADLTATELYNTGLNTGDGNWPNGNAYDPQNNRLYYSVKPNKLYFYDFAGNQVDATNGNPTPGDVACGSFYNGKYYYIPQNSNILYEVTLNPVDGKITLVDDIQTYSGKTFSFGDVVVSLDGSVLYGSSAVNGTGTFWSINLSDYSYTQISNMAHMQLAYGSDGQLYGHDAGNAHFYEIDPVLGT
jgi:hypothetical protein